MARPYKFKEWLDFGDVQDLILRYLRQTTPKIWASNLADYIHVTSTRHEDHLKDVERYVIKTKNQYLKNPNNHARIPLPATLGGHFGFGVIDPVNNVAIVGDPGGSESYGGRLTEYKNIIRKHYPNIKFIPSRVEFQKQGKMNAAGEIDEGNDYDCGRIAAKVTAYLCSTPLSLADAINPNNLELEQFKVGNEDARSRALFAEQSAMFEQEQRVGIEHYQRFIRSIGLENLVSPHSSIHATLKRTFELKLPNLQAVYDQAIIPVVKDHLVSIIENYLVREMEIQLQDDTVRPTRMTELRHETEEQLREIITDLSSGYSLDLSKYQPIVDSELPNTDTISIDVYKAALQRQINKHRASGTAFVNQSNMSTLTHINAMEKMLAYLDGRSHFNLSSDEVASLKSSEIGIATTKASASLPGEFHAMSSAMTSLICDLNHHSHELELALEDKNVADRKKISQEKMANYNFSRIMRGEVRGFTLSDIPGLCNPAMRAIADKYPNLPKAAVLIDLASYVNDLLALKARHSNYLMVPNVETKINFALKIMNTITSQLAMGDSTIELTPQENALYNSEISRITNGRINLPPITIKQPDQDLHPNR